MSEKTGPAEAATSTSQGARVMPHADGASTDRRLDVIRAGIGVYGAVGRPPYPEERRQAHIAVDELARELAEARALANANFTAGASSDVEAVLWQHRAKAAEAVLELVGTIAQSWHGPEPENSGHVKALRVIGDLTRNHLNGVAKVKAASTDTPFERPEMEQRS